MTQRPTFRFDIFYPQGLLALGVAVASGACATSSRFVDVPEPAPPIVEPAEVESVVYLIGDTGDPAHRGWSVLPALAADAARFSAVDVTPRIIFLGDNVYDRGFPADGDSLKTAAARARIDPQIDAAEQAGAVGIFTAGNHDWDNQNSDGWGAVVNQTRYVEGREALMLPREGCPGPEVHNVGERVSLVILDTQWWLHRYAKPGVDTASSECSGANTDSVALQLRARLSEASARGADVIVAGHHPLVSGGRHGGYWTVGDYFFLPGKLKWYHTIPAAILAGLGFATGDGALIGAGVALQLVPPLGHILGRRFVTSQRQDLFDRYYQEMRDGFRAAFNEHRPLAYAAGHDHNLQVHRGSAEPYSLVSGAGSPGKIRAAKAIDSTLCKVAEPGYMRVEFLKGEGGPVVLSLVVPTEGGSGADELCRMFLRDPVP